MPHPHSAENIRDTLDPVIKEWDIPLTKVNVVITDNGSNMVKAFRQIACTEEEDSAEEEEIDETITDTPVEHLEEEEDFEDNEFNHDLAFQLYCKRLSCFAHTLQLVMHKFNEHSFKPFFKKIHTLVKRVNKSSKATEALLSLCHKKIDR